MVQERSESLWHNRDFILLLSGQAVSMLGSSISDIAFPLLVLVLTGSPAQTGFALGLEALPNLIFSLFAGALADRWNRKKVMILCDIGRSLTLASIPVALIIHHLTVVQLYIASFVEGTLFIFFNIAAISSLRQIVSKRNLTIATASNYAAESAVSIIGQSVSGILFSIAHALPFLADAVSYVVSVLSLLWISSDFQQQRSLAPRQMHEEVREGLTWMWKHAFLRSQAFLGVGLNFVFFPMSLIIILLAQRQHASPPIIGIIFTIGSIGSIVGSLLAIRVQKRFSFGQVIISTLWIMTLLWPLYALAPNVLIVSLLTFGIFLIETITSAVSISYRLAIVPDELQGRVNSVHRLLAFGVGRPLGVALAGILSQSRGVILTVMIFFIGWLALTVFATLNTHFRNVPALS